MDSENMSAYFAEEYIRIFPDENTILSKKTYVGADHSLKIINLGETTALSVLDKGDKPCIAEPRESAMDEEL